jgi:hypothetical protein
LTKCPDVVHVRSVNGGQTWGAINDVAQGGTLFAGRNDIAVAGSAGVIINFNVDVVGETGSKLFAIASNDDGVTWASPIRLTTSPNDSDHGSIIGAGNAAYLVWHDDRDLTNREIYFRETLDAGASWQAEEPVSTGALGDSSTPLDAVTPNYVHVIWIDNRGGTYQVYYRRRGVTPVRVDAGATGSGGAFGTGGASGGGASGGGTSDGGPSGSGGAGGASVDSGASAVSGRDGGGMASSARSGSDGACGCRSAASEPNAAGAPLGLGLLGVVAARRRGRRLRKA